MPPRKTKAGPTPVEAIRHKDSRVNIPTEELADFVAEQEAAPPKQLYPRDPSLDPQLVWRGKDEQDRAALGVPVVPVYIQEKVHPQALIENLRDTARPGEREPELTLFADFNGIDDFSKKVDFYHHAAHWANRMILGDSLLVMTSLAEKEGLKGQVQTIYVDPPYGIKFGSNWQVSTRKRDVKDGKLGDLTRQPEQIKAFRDTWELGIHSYLAYLRDRFVVARELLTETGSIFVQIGDENVHLVRSVMDEVFGSENFAGLVTFRKTSGAGSFAGGTNLLAAINDYLVWYVKDKERAKYRQIFKSKDPEGAGSGQYTWLERDGHRWRRGDDDLGDPDPDTKIFRPDQLTSQTVREAATTVFPIEVAGKVFTPAKGGWKTNQRGAERLALAQRFLGLGNTLTYVRYLDDFRAFPLNNLWEDTVTSGFGESKTYVVQTNPKVIERCLLMTTDPGDLVLDPTCGSATTAFVAEQWGRRWITADTSRVALALARTRLMTAKFPYYLLADTAEGATREAELAGRPAADAALAPVRYEGDVKKGFVYRRVPHVTLKSIANNEEIDAIHERFAARVDPLREGLATITGKRHEEWEMPREPGAGWPAEAGDLLTRWWALRRQRQAEIDASIARRADTELLVDQPCEDARRLRVTGPFTVESLAPHRVLAADEERPASERAAESGDGAGRYEATILDNLRKAGVQNTRRAERLRFDRLETFAGQWLQAVGERTDEAGNRRRVAISLGPEHNTVGPTQIREAAKEAMRGVGFDLLVVLGFAFDPHASETAREISPDLPRADTSGGPAGFVAETEQQFGRLPVLLVRMNPDLAMGDDLLKKTGAGNLFMVFGEPDVDLRRRPDGKYEVEIRGLDVYDPTTGVIRNSSTDDIACWLLDTAYDEESFFVRHAYFTGAGDPYEKLRRALRAEVDEAAWATLYRTTSRPFDPPATGKIAVKVINHYGDEVLKVYSVP